MSQVEGRLQKQLEFFQANLNELLKKYEGKFIVIKDETILGAYDSELEAYFSTIKNHELGTFLIHHCIPPEKVQPQVFNSRVIFASI